MEINNTSSRARLGAVSGWVGIGCNVLLYLMKLFAGLLSGSVAILADAWNNLSDASGSVVTLVGFRLADKPADQDHPYGHARYEYLSALVVSALILAIGLELGKSSLEKILRPTPVEFTWVTAAVLLGSIGIKLGLFLFNRRLGKKIGSRALEATAMDSRNDCLATAAVLLSGILGKYLPIPVDGWMGLGVAAFILLSGWGSARETVSALLGERADPELRKQLAEYIGSQPKVLGWHDLMVHDYGPGSRFASIHVEMDRSEDPLHCHELIDRMERHCLEAFRVHMVIHYDPVITDDPELRRMRQLVSSMLQVRDPRITIHDFRMSPEPDAMGLIFDAVIPQELRGSQDAIRRSLEQALNQLGEGNYEARITFDMQE